MVAQITFVVNSGTLISRGHCKCFPHRNPLSPSITGRWIIFFIVRGGSFFSFKMFSVQGTLHLIKKSHSPIPCILVISNLRNVSLYDLISHSDTSGSALQVPSLSVNRVLFSETGKGALILAMWYSQGKISLGMGYFAL